MRLGAGDPRRQLEQQRGELHGDEPEQQRAGQPQQQLGLPSPRSSAGDAEASADGTDRFPVPHLRAKDIPGPHDVSSISERFVRSFLVAG